MTDGYDAKSCNALQRPYYKPVEAALRWCNLTAHESAILQALDGAHIPKPDQFQQWPCLYSNTLKILDAMEHGDLPFGRDGKPVSPTEHVAPPRRTVRHTELRKWMEQNHPGSKPSFLFDEVERSAHSAINAESFRALQADRDAARVELEKLRRISDEVTAERNALLKERDSLRAEVDAIDRPDERSKASYLNTIGALLELLRGDGGWPSDNALIDEIAEKFKGKPGLGKSTLTQRLPDARRSLQSS